MAESKHSAAQQSFIERLKKVHPDSLKIFNEAAAKPFKEQAIFFLNAFWNEFGEFAEFIYAIHHKIFQMADMNAKGVSIIFSYEEGVDLDFDMGLYCFEQMTYFANNPTDMRFKQFGIPKWVVENKDWSTRYSERCMPQMKSALARKKELREKVDVNFDGRVSLLEFLLYQFEADPVELMSRSMAQPDEHPAITKARQALLDVQAAVRAYEGKKAALTEQAQANGGRGVKALRARNMLAQIESSPEWDTLNKALITAEAAVRIAVRKFGSPGALAAAVADGDAPQARTDGAIWWMQRELKDMQDRYGPNKKR